MVKSNIRIFTHGQRLDTGKSVPHYAGETVHYIGAYFELDESWEDYDSVRAVWWNGAVEKATVFDATMTCTIPLEVVAKKGVVMVNLIASVSEDGVLTDRFTSYPFKVAIIDADVKLTGSETVPVTPSQFEQFVEVVKNDADRAYSEADRATDEANRAEQAAEGAAESADRAEQAAGQSGYMFFHIDENGHLIYERTDNVDVDFYLLNGHLYVRAA